MKKPINGKYYPAYAWRHATSYRDVELDKPCNTYEEAEKLAKDMLCDDDCCDVYLYNCNHWWHYEVDYDSGIFVFKMER